MTKDTKKTPAGRKMVGVVAAILAVELVVLAFYLWPAGRAPSPQVDQAAVADVAPRSAFPANVAPAVALGDGPSTIPAGTDVPAAAATDSAGPTLCGGKVCKDDQFCCGPPACGHCANKLTGPECPTKCP
jgi:hypothetical protein